MDDFYNSFQVDELLKTVPGGVAKLAFDDMLTILYATDSFYSMISSSKEKVNLGTPVELLRIVFSTDIIYVNHQLAAQRNRKDNLISLNFRTLQQDGHFKWVLITGSKSNEVHSVGGKTVPVYSCIAMDASDQMNLLKQLEQNNEYNRMITDLSKDLPFEYEIATDTLAFSEIFREIFGKDAVMSGFRGKLGKTKLIHPEELPSVIQIFNSMMSGRKQARFEVRLIPKDGIPCWYICYASIIFDENRNPFKVIGKLASVNKSKPSTEETAPKPQLDALTKICNKASTENLISYEISKQETDTLSAFFVLGIRNYKAINELIEQMSGENILKTIAGLLKIHFRSTDVIGRVATDEFVIFMKNVQSDKIVYEKAEQLCIEVEKLYSFEHSKYGLSLSIGIAFSKGNLQSYQMLATNASAALTSAKKEGSSSFEVFLGTGNN